MSYDYKYAMVIDVIDYIEENYPKETIIEYLETSSKKEEWQEKLYEELWICDSVTGNGSGSYTFNHHRAGKYVGSNLDLLRDALEEFGVTPKTVAEKFLDSEWDYFDVTIRCYLLDEAIQEALDRLEAIYI